MKSIMIVAVLVKKTVHTYQNFVHINVFQDASVSKALYVKPMITVNAFHDRNVLVVSMNSSTIVDQLVQIHVQLDLNHVLNNAYLVVSAMMVGFV